MRGDLYQRHQKFRRITELREKRNITEEEREELHQLCESLVQGFEEEARCPHCGRRLIVL